MTVVTIGDLQKNRREMRSINLKRAFKNRIKGQVYSDLPLGLYCFLLPCLRKRHRLPLFVLTVIKITDSDDRLREENCVQDNNK